LVADQDLPRTGDRVGHLVEDEHFRAAEAVGANGEHAAM
jgi:hypothetical protein